MRIENNDIFYRGKPSSFTITAEMKLAIQNLKHDYYDGAYVDKGLVWTNKDYDFDFMNNLGIAMQFVVRSIKLADLDKDYVEKHEIKDYHIKLINRLYIDEYQGKIETADKRPFGNSYMVGDIEEEIEKSITDDEGNKIYNEVLDLALHTFKEMKIPFYSFIYVGDGSFGIVNGNIGLNPIQREYYNHNWTINMAEYRDKRIDEILE